MPQLITDWKKIGQSGPTIDGRTVDPAWLTQAAESYNPDVYTATIWVDHLRMAGSYGQVRELKAEQEGNILSLYARLAPNSNLLYLNRTEQKMFTSMELDPDFTGAGKCYLVGLAVTDEPASLGTTELRFAARKQHTRNILAPGVELAALQADDENDMTGVGRFISAMAAMFRKHESTQPQREEDEAMNDQQFTKVTTALAGIATAVTTLGDEVKTLKAQEPAGAPAAAGDSSPPPAADAPADTAAQFKAVTDGLSGVIQKLAAIETRMEKTTPGTQAPDISTPAGAGDELL